jgi:O-antigen ligase
MVLFVGGVTGFIVATLLILQRLRTPFEIEAGSPGFFRLKLWQSSLLMLREYWPLGVGLDNFLYQYRTRYILPEAWQEPELSHPHNLVLDFATRLGIGGVIVLLWLQLVFWRSAWQQYRQQGAPLLLGLMGSMAAIAAHGFVDHAFFLVDLALAFGLIVGLVAGLSSAEGIRPRRPVGTTQM